MFFVVGVVVANFGDVAHAINTLPEGYQVLPGVATVIDTTPIGGDCKSVVTPSDGKDRFVPTKTLVEWNAFKSAAPGLGIALNPCLPSFVSGSGCGACPLGVVYHMGGVWDNQFDACKTWEPDGHIVYEGVYYYTQWWYWSWYTYCWWSQGPACYNPWNGITFQWQMHRISTSAKIYDFGWLPYRNW